ncbi:MAG TPA: ActS/PrrB/RegB family redox-sensitive histidine kinase, partial [Alphaproteobacteria bacterium]|nr:ActS/PrrB/RegB family redox-sensitive histidine kinase [Alphaproteobacteria bacterium]
MLIRWVAIAGQLATVLGVRYGLGYDLPIGAALAVIGVSVLLNAAATLQGRTRIRLGDRDAALYLAYDQVQLAVLLSLTGGLINPFSMLLLAPLTVAATILSRQSIIGLATLTLACTTLLAVWHYPLPGPPDLMPASPLYTLGAWAALSVSAMFVAAYVRHVSEEARRVGDALAATQMALAREQRMSALGALAAAAAHELGSPLGTIAVVAKELQRELPSEGPWAEDVALLMSQSARCRDILSDLARRPEIDGGAPYETLALPALIEAAAHPHRRPGIGLRIEMAEDEDGPPVVRRAPELLHGLGTLLQNAIQFARSEVVV